MMTVPGYFMTTFFASVSWVGWLLIALTFFALWQLPSVIRAWWSRPADARKMLPGEDPPTHGSGWH